MFAINLAKVRTFKRMFLAYRFRKLNAKMQHFMHCIVNRKLLTPVQAKQQSHSENPQNRKAHFSKQPVSFYPGYQSLNI